MFQMSKKMFKRFWPVIAAQIASGRKAGPAPNDAVATPSPTITAEAGYVLGIAMGYPLNAGVPASMAAQTPAPIHGWQADACDGPHWPRITSTQIPGAVAISRCRRHGAP
jgi:hypothetical protein